MGHIKYEDGRIESYDDDWAATLREQAADNAGYQPKKGDKFYVAGANGTVYSEKWFNDAKLMGHIALLRIGNVSPTKEAAKAWYAKYGKAFIVNIHDL